jgi:hypothetical protein
MFESGKSWAHSIVTLLLSAVVEDLLCHNFARTICHYVYARQLSQHANWPPIWVSGAGYKTYKKNLGEVGTLIDVILNEVAPDKLFLRMEIKSERQYMGCLAFNDPMFCRQLYIFLQDHIGKSIKEIGDLDLSYTL